MRSLPTIRDHSGVRMLASEIARSASRLWPLLQALRPLRACATRVLAAVRSPPGPWSTCTFQHALDSHDLPVSRTGPRYEREPVDVTVVTCRTAPPEPEAAPGSE